MTATEPTIRPKLPPLLKWPGGKRALLRHILPLVPRQFRTYFEPFLGGAAVFFAIQPPRAVLADLDPGLINCYVQVRDNPSRVIASLSRMQNSKTHYYRIRSREPSALWAKAARTIYLTTLSFNGIYRLNAEGKFNVPYGNKAHLVPCDRAGIVQTSAALSSARLLCADFEEALQEAGPGDFVYCDPPYTVAHTRNGFLKYNSKIFSWDDQLRLAALVHALSDKGCLVLVSNANHPAVLHLYSRYNIAVIERASLISASRNGRGPTTECIITNY